jgi:hypothetical protein
MFAPMAARRFPPPWTVHTIAGGYRVDDANGQALAFVYGRDVHVAHQAKGLTWAEARRIAAGIATARVDGVAVEQWRGGQMS